MSTADPASQSASSPQGGLLARHPLTFYFFIAFAFSWLMFLPGVLTYFGVLNLSDSLVGVLSITGLLGPILSGFIMTAVTELQRLHGPLVGGLILGSLWASWHLPGFLIPSEGLADIPPRGTVLDFAAFALALIGLRLIIQWVFNNTRGSVLMAILVHASWNTFYSAALVQLFPTPSVLGSYLNLTIASCALAIVIVALTRGHLGYEHYQQEDPDLATASR